MPKIQIPVEDAQKFAELVVPVLEVQHIIALANFAEVDYLVRAWHGQVAPVFGPPPVAANA